MKKGKKSLPAPFAALTRDVRFAGTYEVLVPVEGRVRPHRILLQFATLEGAESWIHSAEGKDAISEIVAVNRHRSIGPSFQTKGDVMSTREIGATKKAQTYFRRAEHSEDTAKQIRKKDRAAEAVKTANLRRLRLEKEYADKEAADRLATANGGQPAKPANRSKPARKRAAVRMIY